MKNKYLLLALVAFLCLGLVVSLVLSRQSQDKRNKAFSGYSVIQNAQTVFKTSVLRFAKPVEVPLAPDLESLKTPQGIFYTLASRYQKMTPEYQEVKNTTEGWTGKVFMSYDNQVDKTFIYARIVNFPQSANQVPALWLVADKENQPFIRLGFGQTVTEQNQSVTFFVGTHSGNLHPNGKYLHFSLDGNTQNFKPDLIKLSVNF